MAIHTPQAARAVALYMTAIIMTASFQAIPVTGDDTIGTWMLLPKNAGISSMHTAVTQFGTVLFLERTSQGQTNMTLPGDDRSKTFKPSYFKLLLTKLDISPVFISDHVFMSTARQQSKTASSKLTVIGYITKCDFIRSQLLMCI